LARDFSNIPEALRGHIIINREELLLLVPYAMAHIYRLEAKGFPKRLHLSENRVGWRLVDVLAWIDSRPQGGAPRPARSRAQLV
jgi:predicted DNA-binding transcriptional regulator AlpA